MKKFITAAIVAAMMAIPLTASAVELEPGVEWDHDNGVCFQIDQQEAGLIALDGTCTTSTDYDAIYSYENLSKVPVSGNYDMTEYAGMSIAEVYGLSNPDEVSDVPIASERELGAGLVAEPFTFKSEVVRLFAYGFYPV